MVRSTAKSAMEDGRARAEGYLSGIGTPALISMSISSYYWGLDTN